MEISKKDIPVTREADALRFAYEPNAAKKIAREWGVAIVTAKLWLSGRFPIARREELAARIVTRLEERDALSAAIMRQWAGGSESETNGAVARRRPVAAGDETDEMGAVAAGTRKRGRRA